MKEETALPIAVLLAVLVICGSLYMIQLNAAKIVEVPVEVLVPSEPVIKYMDREVEKIVTLDRIVEKDVIKYVNVDTVKYALPFNETIITEVNKTLIFEEGLIQLYVFNLNGRECLLYANGEKSQVGGLSCMRPLNIDYIAQPFVMNKTLVVENGTFQIYQFDYYKHECLLYADVNKGGLDCRE